MNSWMLVTIRRTKRRLSLRKSMGTLGKCDHQHNFSPWEKLHACWCVRWGHILRHNRGSSLLPCPWFFYPDQGMVNWWEGLLLRVLAIVLFYSLSFLISNSSTWLGLKNAWLFAFDEQGWALPKEGALSSHCTWKVGVCGWMHSDVGGCLLLYPRNWGGFS